MKQLVLLCVLIISLLTACDGPKACQGECVLNDWLYSVEPRANGTVNLWMRHDDVGTYCIVPNTPEERDMLTKVWQIHTTDDPRIVVFYSSVQAFSAEGGGVLGLDGCGDRREGTTVYVVRAIMTPDEYRAWVSGQPE